MRISFRRESGRIVYEDKSIIPYLSGFVPRRIVRKGREAIIAYAETKVRTERERQQTARTNRHTHLSDVHIPIEVTFGDTTLRGAVLEINAWNMRLEMSYPFSVVEEFLYTSGISVDDSHFDEKGEFSKEAVFYACRRLWNLYEREKDKRKHRGVDSLVASLNAR